MMVKFIIIILLSLTFQLNAKQLNEIDNFKVLIEDIVSNSDDNCGLSEKAIETEFLAKGGTITFIHDGENITKEFIFPEEE